MKESHVKHCALLILVFVLSSLLLCGCSSFTATPAAATFPAGTYIPPVQRTAGIEMVFSEDGSFVMSGPEYSPIKVDKDKIVFTQTDAGLCANIPGTYTWTSDGESLNFVAVDDQCSIRRIDWQAGPWKKKQ